MNPLWRPTGPCGAGCLPGPGGGASAAARVRAARFAALCAVGLGGAASLALLPLLPRPRRGPVLRFWARRVLRAAGVRLAVRGRRPPQAGALLVANHVSWLDVVALLALTPARLVAKHEVRRWPVIGALAAAAGTVFVDRSRPRALPRTVATVAAALRSGAVVAAFPEGTTRCGRSPGRFRPALFQAAADAGVPVRPVSLSYRWADGRPTTVAAFLGTDSLARSVCRVVAAPGLTLEVRLSPALFPDPGASRRVLARAAEAAVCPGAVAAAPNAVRARELDLAR